MREDQKRLIEAVQSQRHRHGPTMALQYLSGALRVYWQARQAGENVAWAEQAALEAIMVKGEYMGRCNREACMEQFAVWFNRATNQHYCGRCARLINDSNPDPEGPLCTLREEQRA